MRSYDIRFFRKYAELKEQENWREIIILGNEALANYNLVASEQALIRCRLASCSYYLKEYNEALSYIKDGLRDAFSCPDNNLKVRSLYLMSAVCRAKGEINLAKQYMENALSMVDDTDIATQITDRIKGKVYFNAGALEQDMFKDNQKASKYFKLANMYYTKGSDDYNRTEIRDIRAMLESGELHGAKHRAETLKGTVNLESRTGGQLLLLLTKIYFAKEEYIKAYDYAQQGLKVTEKGPMPFEHGQLENLIEQIKQKCPSVESTISRVNSSDKGLGLGV